MSENNKPTPQDKKSQNQAVFKEIWPYILGFVLGLLVLKWIFYWMLQMGWLYWDDGPGYR
jgi:uncharacterized membrane protein